MVEIIIDLLFIWKTEKHYVKKKKKKLKIENGDF